MGDERAVALAERFRRANDELLALVEGCSPERWRARTAREGWSVGVPAYHIAYDRDLCLGWLRALSSGGDPPPLVGGDIHAENARHAAAYADCTLEETSTLLRRESDAIRGMIASLPGEALDREVTPFFGAPTMSVERAVDRLFTLHLLGHLASIRETTGCVS